MPTSPRRSRHPSTFIGRAAEQMAARWYLCRGFSLLDRNARLGPLELDLVVANESCLVFVEVRARSSLAFGHPAASVDGRKQGRLRVAAARWLAAHPGEARRSVRFDVVGVVGRGPDATLTVFENAF